MNEDKNYALKFLDQNVEIKIDRPMGSKHPRYNYYFPVNYGFVPNTIAPDGEEVDAYILGVFKPIETFFGKCIAVICRTNDKDDKLIVVPDNVTFTDEQIQALTDFQERFFTSEIKRA